MTTRPDPSRYGLVPLADRVRWSAVLRIGLLATAGAVWASSPAVRPDTWQPALLLVVAQVLLMLISLAAPRWGRRPTIIALDAALVLDGVLLVAVLHLLGRLDGFVTVLFVLHVTAVSLLLSFRTGVKVALWHSLLVLVVLHASATGVLTGGALEGRPFQLSAYLGFVALVWTAALATSVFAAVNERELRRRRHDAEVLHGLAVSLASVDDGAVVVRQLARTAVEDLGLRRALVAVRGSDGGSVGRVDDAVVVHPAGEPERPAPVEGEVTVAARPRDPADRPDASGSLLRRATEAGGPVLTVHLGAPEDAWLASRLPAARGVVALPLGLGDSGRGWLVLELGRRRLRGVERRLLATAAQAAAHAGLAITRAAAVTSLRRAAQTDGLTGVANRRFFDESLVSTHRAARDAGHGFAVALLDLDHFKDVNDRHGHAVGDEVLRSVARALREASRAGDVVARYGGEEFAVILSGDSSSATVAAERLRRAVAAADSPVPITCSVGVAAWGPARPRPEDLLRAADGALYRAKEAGRDRVVLDADPAAVPVAVRPG